MRGHTVPQTYFDVAYVSVEAEPVKQLDKPILPVEVQLPEVASAPEPVV